jgi:hypothetical protein
MPDPSEADARINIDQLLREADWDPSDTGGFLVEALDHSLTAKWRKAHATELLQQMEHQSLRPR